MTIKRRTSSKGTPRSAGVSRASAPEIHVAPRILSSEEKRELILAHAAARHPVDPIQRLSVWAGVAVCVVFVVAAWFSTVGSGIRKTLAGPTDPAIVQAMDASKQVMDSTSFAGNEIQQRFQVVDDQLQAAADHEAVVNALAAQLAASSTVAATSTRSDLFRPAAPTSTMRAVSTTTNP